MKTYRADLAAAAREVAGPQVQLVIDSAPTSALAPIAAALGLDPAAISKVAPSSRITRDVSETLRALAAAKAVDALTPRDAVSVTSPQKNRQVTVQEQLYAESRGYAPLHPLAGPPAPPLGTEELFAKYGVPKVRSLSTDLGGGWPLTAEELGRMEAVQQRDRQEFADLMVSKAHQERETALDPQEWQVRRAAEQESITAAETAGSPRDEIVFHTAEGGAATITVREVSEISAAYGRLSGRSDIDAQFFAANSDAVLAHAAYLTRCDTPEQGIGARNWANYLNHAGGDENRARQHVAADMVVAFVREPAVAYTTRASDSFAAMLGVRKIRDHAETVSERWSVDTTEPWTQLRGGAPGEKVVRLDGLLRSRESIAEEPFGLYDGAGTCSASGGVYLPEANLVEELVPAIEALYRSDDDRVVMVATEIAEQALAARSLPTSTLAERTERQWLLVELADAAERLNEDRRRIEDVTLLAVNDPNQMELFDVEAVAA